MTNVHPLLDGHHHSNEFDGRMLRYRDGIGWETVRSASGTGSISSGATTDVITHGLGIAPAAKNITVTLTENPTNDPGIIWVDTITTTAFTVNCINDPGVSNLDFGWQVVLL